MNKGLVAESVSGLNRARIQIRPRILPLGYEGDPFVCSHTQFFDWDAHRRHHGQRAATRLDTRSPRAIDGCDKAVIVFQVAAANAQKSSSDIEVTKNTPPQMLAKRSAREGVRRCRFAYTSTALQKMSNILSSTEYQHQSSFAARVLMILELDRTKPPRITPSGRRCRGRNTVCCKGTDGRGQEGRDQGVFSQFRASCARQIRLGRGHMTFALRQIRVVVEKKLMWGCHFPTPSCLSSRTGRFRH